MDEEVIKKYLEAGRIAALVREEAEKLVEPGAPLLDICEKLEKRIVELGGKPAFPLNISINEIAAHYTSPPNDVDTIPYDSVVKVDVGVHVDGYIADTAFTISFSEKWQRLLDAVKEALDHALSTIKPGVRFAETAKAIEKTIRKYGYNPFINLSGHSLSRYKVHAGESIPNVYTPAIPGKYQAGRAYAIEPFGTNGVGVVQEGEIIQIYSLVRWSLKRKLSSEEKKVLNIIKSNYNTLPFAERWLVDAESNIDLLRKILTKLSRMGFLARYPILIEKKRGIVAQFEHTVIVIEKGDPIVTTR